ncbi:hypothetical protein GDO78_012520 [Eleutherodactylus coqui]|uniref:Fucolectin tachylectin-4 pentraxin-1 domain-containing protein n=1 Tax=Eleutherodactylus coqui TaxID=57060 RepID=A0A8J6F1K2_ELECQ|nr:hypothetical protein GDO78_012520 [Eleutherodactylus coqui]
MGYANKAIDGVKETNYHKGSCSHTNIEKDSWWQVDLKHMYKITNVVLTNRRDCCSERLLHAEIRIGNSPDNNNQVCGTVTSVADASLPFCCNGMLGRYVSVVIPRQLAMVTLCEVEIYGDLVTDEYKVCW